MTGSVVRWQVVSPDPEASTQFYKSLFQWNVTTANAMGTDLDATLRQAESLGAKVIVPKSVLPDGDAMAVLLDPAGIPMGLCTLAKRGS